jgi:hypothetical protein
VLTQFLFIRKKGEKTEFFSNGCGRKAIMGLFLEKRKKIKNNL